VTHALDATVALRGQMREGAAQALAREPAAATQAATQVATHVPRRIRLGMPELDAAGLSENWLFRHAGALQWEAIAQRLGVPSDQLRDERDARLYPTVVAVRARYDAGLAEHRENDALDFSVEVVPCGRACAHGRIVAAARTSGAGAMAPARLLTLDVLTTFAARGPGGLRTTHLAPELARAWTPPDPQTLPEPAISGLARAARRGQRVDDAFSGPPLATLAPALGEVIYEPSPYADYNGAGLLYFASYVTIADTAARQILRHRAPADARDWALATTPVGRDVYYYDNLPLGGALRATVRLAERDATGLITHVRLSRADDGRPMADVIARRQDTP
jgi:probable biosynthetic protein (TIGR04098 family)